jgi:hypothetical protein
MNNDMQVLPSPLKLRGIIAKNLAALIASTTLVLSACGGGEINGATEPVGEAQSASPAQVPAAQSAKDTQPISERGEALGKGY